MLTVSTPKNMMRIRLSWQITPRALTGALAAGGGEATRAFEAMMQMKKIDIAAIEAARRGI
jgi:predicted 3-demethylubiquinone-9 3-methyltransferase (glyoxalase superfamily)